VSPARALELQEYLVSTLTRFPEAEVTVTAKPGGAVIKATIMSALDPIEIKDYEVELFKARLVYL
jgi:hypothetical protein